VHARVAPTRQAVVVMHVVVWARRDHGWNSIRHWLPGQRRGAENASAGVPEVLKLANWNCAMHSL
jgi:hypothetical protein